MEKSSDIFGKSFQVRTKERLLRDPVHGLIPIDENSEHGRLIVRLIDTAEFQRLRRIRQLGMAHYAFQGAEHSRFTHCIGAYHLMERILDQLGRMYTIDSELAFYASVAALLHDLGHGPFSHVAERVFGINHELMTLRILHDDEGEVHQALTGYSRSLPSVIESILKGMAKPGYLSSLVNSELDVDRLDYLLRDSLMTGVKYGIYELDRLIHMFRISPEGDRLIVAHGGMVPVEKYIQARFHMHRQVYLHKTVVAAEAMFGSLLRRATALLRSGDSRHLDPESVLGKTLTHPDEISAAEYLQLDDVELWYQIKVWSRCEDSVLSDLSRRLLQRRLFKTLEIEKDKIDLDSVMKQCREIVQASGLDPDYYFLSVESSDTPYHPYEPDSAKLSHHIWIEDGSGKIVDVSRLSPTILAFTQGDFRTLRLAFPSEHNGIDIRRRIAESLA